jgi:hypothetical protein
MNKGRSSATTGMQRKWNIEVFVFPSFPSPLTSTAIAIALIRSLILSLRRSAPCCARLDQEAGLVQDTQATPQLEVETQ